MTINDLSIEQKIGQLLLVHFPGELPNEAARILVQEVTVGGIIYSNITNSLSSPQNVSRLSHGLQQLAAKTQSKIPLLIAADQEGGVVARLKKGFTIFPGNKALGMTGDPKLAYQCALAMGKEMRSVGVNLTLSPVVDVNSNPRNPVISVRSFGEVAEQVSQFARAAIEGYHEAGVATTLKHFPGHGDVEVDSHLSVPTSTKSLERLHKEDLLPFFALSGETDAIMTAHMKVPAFDETECSTLSKKTLDILRTDAKFQGVIVSDSLVMEGVLKNCPSVEEAAVRALQAGCDMLILAGLQPPSGSRLAREVSPEDAKRIRGYIMEAIKTGRITEQHVDESVARILSLKKRYALIQPPDPSSIGDSISTQTHRDLAHRVAAQALQTKNTPPSLPLPIQKCTLCVIAPTLISEHISTSKLSSISADTRCFFFDTLNPSSTETEAILDLAQKVHLCIFCSYNAWKNTEQIFLVQQLQTKNNSFLIIATRDPQDASLFPPGSYVIKTFSPTEPSLTAAAEKLIGL